MKEKLLNGEVLESTEVVENGEVLVDQGTNELEVTGTAETTKTPAAEEKPKKLKWYEEEGAFPYQAGDTVQIITGKDLHLRKAVVVGPSTKKNALKAQLIHPIKNEPQKTQCSFDFDRLLLIESNGQQINEPLTELPGTEEQAAM